VNLFLPPREISWDLCNVHDFMIGGKFHHVSGGSSGSGGSNGGGSGSGSGSGSSSTNSTTSTSNHHVRRRTNNNRSNNHKHHAASSPSSSSLFLPLMMEEDDTTADVSEFINKCPRAGQRYDRRIMSSYGMQRSSMALLVMRGGCSFYTKAVNALALNSYFAILDAETVPVSSTAGESEMDTGTDADLDLDLDNNVTGTSTGSGSGSGSGSGTVNGTMDNNDKNNTTTTTTPMGIRPKIEYLIIMNSNNDKRANRTFPMRKEAGESDLEDIGLVSMGYSNGMHLLCSMVFRNEISNNNNNDKNNNGQETGQQESILGMGTDMYLDSMAFLPLDSDQRTARDWMFPVNIDAMTVDGGSMKNKLLLVFILVTLLFPIVRMVLFCCIHHREFQWRRNERGRINGFTWSRRMLDMEHDTASWIGAFTGRNGLNSDARGPIVLSPEGVKKLPIIEFGVESVQDVMARYRWLSSDYNDDDDENDNKNRNVNHELKRLHHVDNHHQQGRSYYHDDDDIPKSQDENNNKTEKDLIAVAYDSCVTCSICICDFEHGEKLRLLPDCGHVFHTECIMPWLTGKKNSCPLCQRKVKVSEEDMGYRDDESFQLRIATSLISGQDQRNTSMNVSESFEQSDAPVSVEREEQNDDLSTASTNHSSRHEEGSSSSSSSSNDVDALSSSRTDSNIYP